MSENGNDKDKLKFSLETHPFYKMVVDVTSNFGVGKTKFALGCGIPPKNITFINDDVKTPPMFGNDKDFGYQKYIDLMDKAEGLHGVKLCEFCLDMIKELDSGQVLIWDTFYRFEDSLHPYVDKNPSKFRDKYNGTSDIIRSLKWLDSFDYEGEIILSLKKKFDIVFLTRHVKNLNINGKRIEGAFRPKDKPGAKRSIDIGLWLLPNKNGGEIPSAIVMKNFSKDYYNDGSNGELPGIKIQRVLPPKIPKCDLDHLWDYWQNPTGGRELQIDERVNEEEYHMLTGNLTKNQFDMFSLQLRAELLTNEDEKEITKQLKDVFKGEVENIRIKAKELKSEGMNNFQISKELKKLFSMFEKEITIPIVKDWVN